MDHPQSNDIDSTTDTLNKDLNNVPQTTYDSIDETPTINSANPDFTPVTTTTATSHSWETNNPVVDSITNKGKTELKKGQQQVEDIVTKTKRILKQHCKLVAENFSNTLRNP